MRLLMPAIAGLVFMVSLGWASESKAWGEMGHLTVCDLAYRNLTDDARTALIKLIRGEDMKGSTTVPPKGRTQQRTYTAFNYGCLEEDTRPRENEDDHFINLGRDATDVPDACPPTRESCIIAGIREALQTLRDPSKSKVERVRALFALGHWIGDLHQPLHVSFSDDLGGNSINARLVGVRCGTSRYRVQNLHGLWDNCLLQAGLFEKVRTGPRYRPTWKDESISYEAANLLMARTSLADEKRMVEGSPVRWAKESYDITLRPATQYCTPKGGECWYSREVKEKTRRIAPRQEEIDAAYVETFAPRAEERVRLAGFRLAHLINGALDPNYRNTPIQNDQPV